MSRIFFLTVTLGLAAAAASAVDCGELPRGKNPPPDEIARAMEELSFAFSVPTEIIKGVSYQESGTQQWRADGSFVYNTSDCGLGMMQLTGATAEQYDVERLKTDWKYNLEAGVKVLQSKWKRVLAERWKGKSLPPPDPVILENWYYALSYYQGKRTGEYPGKVFSHIKNRPGVMTKLLGKSVPISNPEQALPGFAYGGGYTALAGDRFVLDDGREVKAPTHQGTIGDPKLLAELDQVLAAAEKARERDELRKAIRYYQAVAKMKPDSEPGRKADAALKDLSVKAKEALAKALTLAAAKDWAGALIALDDIEGRYLGLPEADEAGARADAIRADPEIRASAQRIEAEKDARFILGKADAALARKDALEALRILRKAAAYADTAAGAEAANRLRQLEADPAFMAEVRERERARQLREWLGLAQGYLDNDLPDRAVATLRKVIEAAPAGSPEAEKARKLLKEVEERRGG